jgi:hypothetical protein
MEALARMVEKKLEAMKVELEATKVELFNEFQEILGSVLLDVSRKYEIKFEELESEYLTSSGSASSSEGESPAKPKATKKRRVKAADEDRKKCSAKTAKGAACKNFALAGCEFCACHSKAKADPKRSGKIQKMRKEGKKGTVKPVSPPSSDEIDSDAESVKSPVKPRKASGASKGKKAQVVHDHAIDQEVHEECAACEVLGNTESPAKVMVDEDVKKVLDELFMGSDAEDSGSETEEEGEDE